jgi:hypothetical protein
VRSSGSTRMPWSLGSWATVCMYQAIGMTGTSSCRSVASRSLAGSRAAGSASLAAVRRASAASSATGPVQFIAPQSPPPGPTSWSAVPNGTGVMPYFAQKTDLERAVLVAGGITEELATDTSSATPIARHWSWRAAAMSGSSGRSGKARSVRARRSPSRVRMPSAPGSQPRPTRRRAASSGSGWRRARRGCP